MKAIIIINSDKQNEIEWKFNQALAFLSFDVDLHLVFYSVALNTLTLKQWKTMTLYSDNELLVLKSQRQKRSINYELENFKFISISKLKKLIEKADMVL